MVLPDAARSPNGATTRRGITARGCRVAWLLLFLVGSLLLMPRSAAAHAALEESDPTANAIMATAPARVTLTYTEPLERSYSRAELYDQAGNLVDGAASRAGADDFQMVVDLPAGLPNGTYSVLWRSLSTADGHTAQGYFAFTVGTAADVQTVVPPALTATEGPPDWLRTVSRWLALLGLAATVAVWPIWLFVLRPAISPVWQLGPGLTRRIRWFAVGALAFAVGGSVVALLVQAAGIGGSAGLLDGLRTTLGETRYGTLWLIRIGLFLVFAAALMGAAWWRPWRRSPLSIGLVGFSALLPLPFSLIAHAAAQPEGRATAIAFDLLHATAASLWVGGLFVLVVGLVPTLRDLTPAGRREVLARAIPRFSTIALIAWAILVLSGLYNAWLNVGNLEALRTTDYGKSLILKLAILVPLLGLAAFNLLVVNRRLRRAREERTATIWSGFFVTAIASEAVLVILVLLVVGRLTAQPPARDVVTQASDGMTIALDADGQQGTLTISPGAAGPNQYLLQLGSGHDHSTSRGAAPVETVLRVELPERETGEKDIPLRATANNAYEGDGSELSIAGDWTITAIVRQAGQQDWRATVTQNLGTEGPVVDVPGPPWRFNTAGVGGVALVAAGLACVVVALRAGRSPLRKEAAGLGVVSLLIGLVLLFQARLTPESTTAVAQLAMLPAGDPAAIDRGAALFAANCVACHGVQGRGDGPRSGEFSPPPADLTAPHALVHRDQDIAYWIANGIAGSAMPAFGDSLSEDEIADLTTYLRDIQAEAALARDAPGTDDCLVAPRSIDELETLTAGNQTPREVDLPEPTPLPAGGAPPAEETVAEITAAAREMVACSNAGDNLRRLALFSDSNVRQSFPNGPTEVFKRLVTASPVPVPAGERVALLGIDGVQQIGSERVRAEISIDNPTRHTHGPAGAAPAAGQTDAATIVYVKDGDRWLIDEVVP